MANKGHKELEKISAFFFFAQAKAVQKEPFHFGCPEQLLWLPQEASHSGPTQHWEEVWTAGLRGHLG